MHLCALVEDEDRRGRVFVPSSPIPPRISTSAVLSVLGLRSPSLRTVDCGPLLSFLRRRFPSLSSSLELAPTSILRHPAYIAGGDRIIVRRIPVRFLRGANKTGLRASRVSYGPSCALHIHTHTRKCTHACVSQLTCARAHARSCVRMSCVCTCATNIAQYRGPSRWDRI